MPYKDPEIRRIKGRERQRLHRLRLGMKPKPPKLPPDCEHKDRPRKGDGLCRQCYKKKRGFEFLLRHRYGIEVEVYEQKLAEQGGVCAICKGVSRKRLSVDHNHTTGEVRGLLCVPCNAGVGNFKERTDLMYAAITYVEKWS